MLTRRPYDMHVIDIKYDAIDEYFECITACAIGDDGMQCITQCIEVHLKEGAKK